MSLRNLGFKIEWLQINNPDGNPIEIVASKNDNIFWIECKSMKLAKKIDDYHDRLHQVLIQDYEDNKEQIKNRWWMAFLVKLERPIADEIEFKRIKWLIKWVMKRIAYNVPNDELPLWIIYEIDTPIRFEYASFLVNDTNHAQIAQYFHQNAVVYGGYSYAKKQSWSDLPDPEEMNKSEKKMHTMMGIGYPKDTTPKERTVEAFEKQLKRKVSQQKSLIDAQANVIIIFDWESICNIEDARNVASKYTKYSNLTILVTHTQKTPLSYDFEALITSDLFY